MKRMVSWFTMILVISTIIISANGRSWFFPSTPWHGAVTENMDKHALSTSNSRRGVQLAPYSEYVHINEIMFMPEARYNDSGVYGEFDEWIEIYYDINAPGPLYMDNWTIVYNGRSIASVNLYELGEPYGIILPPLTINPGDYVYINFSDPPSYYDFSDFASLVNTILADVYDTDGNGIHIAYYKAIMRIGGIDVLPDMLENEGGCLALYNATGMENLTVDHLIDFVAWDRDGILNESQKMWDDNASITGKWRDSTFIYVGDLQPGESIGLQPNGSDNEPVSRWYLFSEPTYGERPDMQNDPSAKYNASNVGGEVINYPSHGTWDVAWSSWYSGQIMFNISVFDPDWVYYPPKIIFEYSLDNTTWTYLYEDTETPYSATWDTSLIVESFDDSVWVRARIIDDLGEVVVVQSPKFGVDNAPPTLHTTSTNDIVKDTMDDMHVYVNASDQGSGISRLWIKYMRGPYDNSYQGPYEMIYNNGTWTYVIPMPEGGWSTIAGYYVYYVIIMEDHAGNIKSSDGFMEWVDAGNLPPQISWLDEWSKDKWYSGDIWLNVSAYDSDGNVVGVYFEYSVDSPDGISGTWILCDGSWYNGSKGVYCLLWRPQEIEGTVWIRAWCQDDSGLLSTYAKVAVGIDLVGPNTTILPSIGWYNTTVNVTLRAVDNGSGVAITYYSLDNMSIVPYGGENITISEIGSHIIRYYSVDIAGNIESMKEATFGIDPYSPVLLEIHWEDLKADTSRAFEVHATVNDNISGIYYGLLYYRFGNAGDHDIINATYIGYNEYVFIITPKTDTWMGMANETIYFYLTFYDIAYNSISSEEFMEFIEAPNNPPIITKHLPETDIVIIEIGAEVDFAIDAYDPDGDPLETLWYVDGNLVAMGLYYTFIPEAIGNYRIWVSVDDGNGNTIYIEWNVVVLSSQGLTGGDVPRIYNIQPKERNLTVNRGENITFRAMVDYGDRLYVEWSVDGTIIYANNIGPKMYKEKGLMMDYVFSESGNHIVLLKVSDGIYTTTILWYVWVMEINDPPNLIPLAPLPYGTILKCAVGETTVFMAAINDDSPHLKVVFVLDGVPLNTTTLDFQREDNIVEYTMQWNRSMIGEHIFEIKVSDENYTTYLIWNISVDHRNAPPVLQNPCYFPDSIRLGEIVTFMVTYRDIDGDPPKGVYVVINDKSYPMIPLASNDTYYMQGVVYYTKIKVDERIDILYFKCSDGTYLNMTPILEPPRVIKERVIEERIYSDFLLYGLTILLLILLLFTIYYLYVLSPVISMSHRKRRKSMAWVDKERYDVPGCQECVWFDSKDSTCGRFNVKLQSFDRCERYRVKRGMNGDEDKVCY